MPRHPIPYFPKLTGYTAPVVIEILDQLGPPGEISKLPISQQGPMLVTFMGEMASVISDLIMETVRKGTLAKEIADLRIAHGGGDYRDLLKSLDDSEAHWYALFNELIEHERQIIRDRFASTIVGYFKGERQGPGSAFQDRYMEWNPELNINRNLLTAAKTKHTKLCQEYEELRVKINSLAQLEAIGRTDIESKPTFQLAMKDLLLNLKLRSPRATASGVIQIDFASATSLALDGAAHYLRNTDGIWWRAFTDRVSRKVERDSIASAPRIVLRDPLLAEKIQTPDEERSMDLVTQDVLADPGSINPALPWPKSPVSENAARNWRRVLRNEDEYTCDWIERRAPRNHPGHPYRKWSALKSLAQASPNRDYLLADDYSLDRALNELYWCLSRRHPEQYPFRPCPGTGSQTIGWDKIPPTYFELSLSTPD